MSFPGTHAAIRRMALRAALETQNARGVARKAGLRAGTSTPSNTVRTLLDVLVLDGPSLALVASPEGESEQFGIQTHQWELDLSGISRIRLEASGAFLAVAFVSPNSANTSDLETDPFDTDYLRGILDEPGHPDNGTEIRLSGGYDIAEPSQLLWIELSEEKRVPVRFYVASLFLATAFSFSQPFALSVQGEVA